MVMPRVLGIVISIGLADSLNPSTIAPALFLATGERSRGRVAEFTVAVFVVYLLGGVAIALGPGQLILTLASHPQHFARHLIEAIAGVALLAAAALVWHHRERLALRALPDFDPHGRSSWILGATITAIELPTAFPYFAAIATIVGSGESALHQVTLLVVFDICFVLPLITIFAMMALAPDRAERVLQRVRAFLERRWPQVLSGLLALAGVVVVLVGTSGLAAVGHGHFARLMRRLHGILRP